MCSPHTVPDISHSLALNTNCHQIVAASTMFMPQLPALLLLLLGKVVASNVPSDDHFALLQSRQAPGSPVYECHESCGEYHHVFKTVAR